MTAGRDGWRAGGWPEISLKSAVLPQGYQAKSGDPDQWGGGDLSK